MTRYQTWRLGCRVSLLAITCATCGWAAPKLRTQVDLRGDFVLFGNTIGWDCATNEGIPAPTSGNAICSGVPNANDSGIDLFWRSDYPNIGDVTASSEITAETARSTAVLELPPGARITYARLYWGGYQTGATRTVDATAIIERPQTTFAPLTVTALPDAQWSVAVPTTNNQYWYQASAEVTPLLQAAGTGAYRVSDIAAALGTTSESSMVGWAVVVFYELEGDTPRNLALFDGLDAVGPGVTLSTQLSGFLVPQAGFKAKLGVLAYEGDAKFVGDQLVVNGTAVGDTFSPANNFFNGTYSNLNTSASHVGDLPRLSGAASSMSGIDIDVVDMTDRVKKGETSATISATTGAGGNADRYVLGAFVTSISTYKPDFTTSGKTVSKVTPGALRPGSVLEYTVTITNTGNDDSINTVMTDVLPSQVTYVDDSLAVASPAGATINGEYNATSHTLTIRLGAGANATKGGTMAVGETIQLKFQVSLNEDASGSIDNQARITADGKLGADKDEFLTDGNGSSDGVPPTSIEVDHCAADGECSSPTPYCDLFSSPHTCVGCVTSDQCTNATAPECNTTTRQCECPAGNQTCVDSDSDGLTDVTETAIGTNPQDADSDDDGVPDGSEYNPSEDADGDGLINALDPDSDNDGLFDGTEMGLDCEDPATDLAAKRCVPDQDLGVTKTNPLDADSDDGGVSDGSEDSNLNGAIDSGETNPNLRDDDSTVIDTDGDGLSDTLEGTIESDPNDRDSDDDGVVDGAEANPTDDVDRDGLIDVLDADSDGDGLFDGTEMGFGCTGLGTELSAAHCIADADGGQSKTSPVIADTDRGGMKDGTEDRNHNGRVDSNERNPNDRSDDNAQCYADEECGDNVSGKVCNPTHVCVDGCRGINGNGCPSGQVCTSANETIGTCSGQTEGTGGASSAGGATSTSTDISLGGALAVGGATSTDISLGGALAVGGATSVDTSLGGALAVGGSSGLGGAPGGTAAIGGGNAMGGAGTSDTGVGGGTSDVVDATGGALATGGASGEVMATGGETAHATLSTDTSIGAPDSGVTVEGGGCSCGIVGARRSSGAWLAIAAGLLTFWRRRRAR